MRRATNQRGAAAVETAMVFGLLLLIAIGAVEYGFAFRDWMSVSGGSREGARVGAQAGDEPGADCRVLEAAAGSLQSIDSDDIVQVWIYKTDTAGVVGIKQRYRPSIAGDNPVSLRCGGTWFLLENGWPEGSRDNDGATRDWLGARVQFDHDWITGFLWFSGSICNGGLSGTCWQQDTIMHVEPDPTT